MSGWIKLHRSILDSKYGCSESSFFVFVSLLLMVNHKDGYTQDGTLIKKGQIMTSRKALSQKLRLCESKLYRILKRLEIEHQIEQLKSNKNTIITITNWESYQSCEQQTEQQVNNKRTTNEQQVNTNKNNNNNKNNTYCEVDAAHSETGSGSSLKNKNAEKVISLMNFVLKAGFKNTKTNLGFANGRLAEGYSMDDFERVFKNKLADWGENEDMKKYLRPQTLLGTKFDAYLNEKAKETPMTYEDFFNTQSKD